MSDLSRLLEDVYRSGSSAPTPEPAWASDRALDEAFADWVPGPPADAPEEERAYANTPDAAAELAAALGAAGEPDREAHDPYAALQALLDEAIRRAPDIVDDSEVADESGALDEPITLEAPAALEAPITLDAPITLEVPVTLEAPVEAPVLVGASSAAPQPAFVPPTPVPGWTLTDDDILPVGRTRRGLFRRR